MLYEGILNAIEVSPIVGTQTIKAPKRPMAEVMSERETGFINLSLTRLEFAALVEVNYDDRFGCRQWRVRGDEPLYYWLHDVSQNRDQEPLTDAEVISIAYERFRAIQMRGGQVNSNSVYVQDCENIELFPRRDYKEYATVCVVKDRIDGLYRWATSYAVHLGGSGYAPWLGESRNIAATREQAAMLGAREIVAAIERGWEVKANPDKFLPFIRKIQAYIENQEEKQRQPTLFGG